MKKYWRKEFAPYKNATPILIYNLSHWSIGIDIDFNLDYFQVSLLCFCLCIEFEQE